MMAMKLLRKTICATAIMGASCSSVLANDGHMGLDFSFSTESANIGLYSLKETPEELTNLGVDYFFNQDDDFFLDVFGSLSRKGFGGDPNMELGLKGKIFYTDHKDYNQTGYGIMLGGTARYWLPTEIPVTIAGDLLYGPDIVTFEKVESALQFEIRSEVQILPSAFAYVGYRKLDVTFEKGSKSLDNLIHIGVNVGF